MLKLAGSGQITNKRDLLSVLDGSSESHAGSQLEALANGVGDLTCPNNNKRIKIVERKASPTQVCTSPSDDSTTISGLSVEQAAEQFGSEPLKVW